MGIGQPVDYRVECRMHVSQEENEEVDLLSDFIPPIDHNQGGVWRPTEDKHRENEEKCLRQFHRSFWFGFCFPGVVILMLSFLVHWGCINPTSACSHMQIYLK